MTIIKCSMHVRRTRPNFSVIVLAFGPQDLQVEDSENVTFTSDSFGGDCARAVRLSAARNRPIRGLDGAISAISQLQF